MSDYYNSRELATRGEHIMLITLCKECERLLSEQCEILTFLSSVCQKLFTAEKLLSLGNIF